ncbi:MAG TPA: Gfo/Idh/MocA family oxidoreductase [Roseiflexaceae bacterium]|nr:Gfo/Idh/MocA family oxidoreductase [Roseiflexaceae bacterium]
MTSRIRWGILSTANIGKRAVIPGIQRSNNGEVVAIASRDAAQAQAAAAELRIGRAHGSYEALLEDSEVDAIYIPLPNSMHREWTIRAAQAGKHILCEKPLAMNAAECAEMQAAAEQHGVLLMEAFMYRFHPQTLRVQELVRQGAIGDARLLKATFSFHLTNPANIRLNADLGGGGLMDVGCYCVNVSRTMFAAEPVEAQAYASWSASGVDELLVGTLRFADGRLAQIECSLALAGRQSYQIIGADGFIEAPTAFVPGLSDTTLTIRQGNQTETETIGGVDQYQLMVEHFGECVRGNATLRYPASEAVANMRVIEALYESARQNGRPVTVAR